jgi:hypothetical protein
MNRQEIKDEVKKLTIADIKSVIDGEKDSVSLMYARPNEIIKIAESLGLEHDEDSFGTNGWQWDYSVMFEDKDGNKFSAWGDGYYSDGGSFGKDE